MNYVKLVDDNFFNLYIANNYHFVFVSSVNFIAFFYYPLCIFDILYATLCCDIVSIIVSFRQVLKKSTRRDYDELTDIYNNIITLSEYFDSEVDILAFNSLLYNACTAYYGLTLVLKNDVEDDVQFCRVVFDCFLNCINFITTVLYESRTHVSTVS